MADIFIETTWPTALVRREVEELIEPLSQQNVSLSIHEVAARRTLPEIAIVIAGGVGVHIIAKLIDLVLNRFKRSSEDAVFLVHQDFNLTFVLPEDREKCLSHFRDVDSRRLAADTGKTSHEIAELERMVFAVSNPAIQKGLLNTLVTTAVTGDLESAKALLRICARHQSIDRCLPIINGAGSHVELIRQENLTAGLRLYAMGLSEEDDLKEFGAWLDLADALLRESTDIPTKHLLEDISPVQD